MQRVAVRLTDEALAELQGRIERLVRPSAQETEGGTEAEPAGGWVRLLVAVVDLEDRPEPESDASSTESASSESEPP